MISVLIVDDEHLIRSLIRRSIPWAEHGMEVIGEAADGEEALAFIKERQPQIAIVDINIPFINGLELARTVYEEKYSTNVIFLTGYRNFAYAKKAVTYHVFDYLLKPLNVNDALAVLDRLCQKIEKEQQLHKYVRDMEHRDDKGQHLFREQYLHRLAFGRPVQNSQKTIGDMRSMDILLQPENLLTLVAEVGIDEDNSDSGLYVYAVYNMLGEIMSEEPGFSNVTGFTNVDDSVIMLCNAETGAEESVRRIWQRLLKTVREYFTFNIFAGVSQRFSGFDGIPESVRSAMEAIEKRFYSKDDTLFFAEPHNRMSALQNFPSSVDLERIQMCVNVGDWDGGAEAIRNAFQQMREQQWKDSFCRTLGMSILAVLYSLAMKFQIPGDALSAGDQPLAEKIDTCLTCEELEELLLTCYNQLREQICKVRPISDLISRALDYINKNYCTSTLSLGDIAASVYAAPAYISSLFKKEMGMSVMEYVMVKRMKKAAEIISAEPRMCLRDVSEQVGYTDPYYFSRSFKKYYGFPPSKFSASNNMN